MGSHSCNPINATMTLTGAWGGTHPASRRSARAYSKSTHSSSGWPTNQLWVKTAKPLLPSFESDMCSRMG